MLFANVCLFSGYITIWHIGYLYIYLQLFNKIFANV